MEQGVSKVDNMKDVKMIQESSKPESGVENAHQSLKGKSKFDKRSQPGKLKI